MSGRKKGSTSHRPATRRQATIARITAAIVGVGGGTVFAAVGVASLDESAIKGAIMILLGIGGATLGLVMANSTKWMSVELEGRERDASTGRPRRERDIEF